MKKALFALLAAALTVVLAPQAQAKWPEKPIRLILPFGAGGVADVTSRIMAAKLSEKLGQQVVIENMPGPGGINAARAVITAPPDGYTMALVTNGTSISVAAFNKLPFDPVKDFAPVSMVGTFDLVFAVDAKSEFKTLQDFMTAAKANPGKFNVGTVLLGGTQNLGAELFKSMTGLNFQVVVYKNSPDIVVALSRHDVQMMIDFPPAVQGQVNAGKVRLLATSSPKRTALLPNCWIKVCGAERISLPPYAEAVPIARKIVEAAPERVLWGTDFPHPNPTHEADEADLVDLVPQFAASALAQQRLLVDNPARLYGFA